MFSRFSSVARRRRASFFIVAGALGFTAVSALARPPEVGDLAPDFELQQLNGGLVTLSEFKGKVVLLNFFGYD